MHCCCSRVDEGGDESAGYEPEMGGREQGEDEGAVVEEAGEEGVCTLKMLAEYLFRLFLSGKIYTARIYTDTESFFIVKNHSSHIMRASRVGIIKCIHTDQASKQAQCNAQDFQRGRHIPIQFQALQYTFRKVVAIERPPNGEAEFCTRQCGTAILSILIL